MQAWEKGLQAELKKVNFFWLKNKLTENQFVKFY